MRLKFFFCVIVGFFACCFFVSQCWAFFDFIYDYRANVKSHMAMTYHTKAPVSWMR